MKPLIGNSPPVEGSSSSIPIRCLMPSASPQRRSLGPSLKSEKYLARSILFCPSEAASAHRIACEVFRRALFVQFAFSFVSGAR